MPSLTGINLDQTIHLTEAVKGKLNYELERADSSLRKVACHAVLFDNLIETLIDFTENGYVKRVDGSVVKISSLSTEERQDMMKQHSPSSKSNSPSSSPSPSKQRKHIDNHTHNYNHSSSQTYSKPRMIQHYPSKSKAPLKSCLKKTKSTKF